ncbi:MAG TPA: ABC transporter ATP-binding protein [Sphingobium sp.]|uniref:ABC transporter ATP-binding protein n=1 Tax=Sphingobium sp. TaxID=1912891 RepID=UPI002ED442B9
MSRLQLDHVSVPIGQTTVLRDISLMAEGGAFIGLVGPNGAGKSTLARTIAGLLTPSAGTISVDGRPLSSLGRREAARTIAYLAQGDAVHWPLAARNVVALGRSPHLGPLGKAAPADEAAIDRAMARTQIEAFADRDVTRLSGGERGRVLLARALAVEAPILVADEPVGALDPRHALNIMELLQEEARCGKVVIAVLHDLALAVRFCDRLIVLGEGRLVGDGPPREILSPEGLARHYAVIGHHGSHEEQAFVLPWRALP